jgi:epoxyqueuosine reductase
MMNEIIQNLQEHLSNAGFKSTLVSVHHLRELKKDTGTLLKQKTLNLDFYNEISSRYHLQWNYEIPSGFNDAKSVLIVAARQPKIDVSFQLLDKAVHATIPPTYLHDIDKEIFNGSSLYLNDHGFKIDNALLPEKHIAVHSGLARYGRNNIAYIDGWGSHFTVRTFFTDIPCPSDNWQELKMMDRCQRCSACIKKCPTQAIHEDPFLISGERCITFFNEKPGDFPEWIDPKWHNCLIGCMIYQDICPENKEQKNRTARGEEFSVEETHLILDGVSQDKLPDPVIEKLKKIYLFDEYHLLQRNLEVLINKID